MTRSDTRHPTFSATVKSAGAVPLLERAEARARAEGLFYPECGNTALFTRAPRDARPRPPATFFAIFLPRPRSRKCHPYKPYIKRRYGVCRVYPRRPLPIPMAPPAAPVEPPAWPRPLWAGRRSARPLGAPPARPAGVVRARRCTGASSSWAVSGADSSRALAASLGA